MRAIKLESRRIRALLGLSGLVDVYEVARQLGVRVDERLFSGKKVHEITIGVDRIAVRRQLGYRERRWAIAHGLGHTVLHTRRQNHVWLNISGQSTDKFEREAEEFALHLLVDTEHALHMAMREVMEIAAYYGVPIEKVNNSYPFGAFD